MSHLMAVQARTRSDMVAEIIDASELASRWRVPVSWVREYTRLDRTDDPILTCVRANTCASSGVVQLLNGGLPEGETPRSSVGDPEVTQMRHIGRPKGQRGWIYKKGGIYMLRWREQKRQPDGSVQIVQRSKSLGYFRTKSEARAAAEVEMRQINAAIQNPQSCMRLADFVEHHYFPHIEKRLRPSTVHSYKRLWKDYSEFWPDLELRQFRTLHGDQTLTITHQIKLHCND